MWFGKSQFFVSHIKAHKPLSPSAVSWEFGQLFEMTGVKTEVFKTNLPLSESPSKAEVTGVSLTDIIKQVH